MLKILSLSLLLFSSAQALSFQEYKQQTQKNFAQEKANFKAYKEEQKKAFESYIKELQKYWKKPILTSKKVLVAYSKDKKSRTFIDFAHNELKIQTLAKNEAEAEQKMKLALAKAVTFDTKDFYENDALEQKFVQIEKQKSFDTADVEATPILAPVLFQKKTDKKNFISLCQQNSRKSSNYKKRFFKTCQ